MVSADQLLRLIDKITTYETRPAASPAALLIADVPDGGGNFSAGIQQANDVLAGKFTCQMLLAASQPDLATLRQAIQTGLNNGVDLVSYLGHGSVSSLRLAAAWYHAFDAADLDGGGITDIDDYLLQANHWNERGDAE